jgi:MIP family channel proteins
MERGDDPRNPTTHGDALTESAGATSGRHRESSGPAEAREASTARRPDRGGRSSARRGRSREEGGSSSGLYGSDAGADPRHASVAELVGTFILVFTGIAVACAAALDRPIAGNPLDSLSVAMAFGLILAAIVAAIGHISGAHVNPAVTLGLAATGKFPTKLVPAYLAAQLGGAILAGIAAWLVFGGDARDEARLGATYPTDAATIGQAFIVEILITFILVFIVLAVATDKRAPSQAAPLAVGFALFAGVAIGGPISGGAVNPARALGPMIVAGDLSAFWLYILGPIIGGVAAAFLYDRVVSKTDAPG